MKRSKRGGTPLASEMYRALKLRYNIVRLVCAALASINLVLVRLLLGS